MPYTPSKIWANGDVLNASDVQNNLDGFKTYNHSVPSGDIKTTQWVDTKHIMPGVIDAQTTVTNNCSGMFGGQQHSWQTLNYSFLTRWNTTRSAATSRYLVVPETSFTINLGKPASMFYQWWMQVESRDDGYTDGLSYIYAVDDSVSNSTHIFPEQSQATLIGGAAFNTGVNISGVRSTTGFLTNEGTSLSFAIGLKGRSENGQCMIMSWGISLEVFYL